MTLGNAVASAIAAQAKMVSRANARRDWSDRITCFRPSKPRAARRLANLRRAYPQRHVIHSRTVTKVTEHAPAVDDHSRGFRPRPDVTGHLCELGPGRGDHDDVGAPDTRLGVRGELVRRLVTSARRVEGHVGEFP